jgi:hypothetical protein
LSPTRAIRDNTSNDLCLVPLRCHLFRDRVFELLGAASVRGSTLGGLLPALLAGLLFCGGMLSAEPVALCFRRCPSTIFRRGDALHRPRTRHRPKVDGIEQYTKVRVSGCEKSGRWARRAGTSKITPVTSALMSSHLSHVRTEREGWHRSSTLCSAATLPLRRGASSGRARGA